MTIEYRQAAIEDAELMISIYNAAYYDDYLRYGYCPGYGITKEGMEESIKTIPKYIIMCDNMPVGCISSKQIEIGVYEIANLCIIPEYQGKGIGTQAMRFIKSFYEDWVRLTLVTPIDKKENVKFYTEKCGFRIESTERDGNVELFRFVAERSLFSDKEEENTSLC
jgi:ribosomal protein S18 acetylase RimI-like enzyme